MRHAWSVLQISVVSMFVSALALLVLLSIASARDDGRYAASPLKPWFDSLQSKKGACCSDADGTALSDVDWTTKDGHFRVRIEGAWYNVPDEAVLTQPNLSGRTIVWPVIYRNGATIRDVEIRCFIPGEMT